MLACTAPTLRKVRCKDRKARLHSCSDPCDDPALSSGARRNELARENAELRERLARLEELEPGRAREEAPKSTRRNVREESP